jgi:hypothetical protein
MATHSNYHLKELVWFHGWSPSHWILIDSADGLTARCTRPKAGQAGGACLTGQDDLRVSADMLTRIERASPGSLPAMMGFDYLLCEGEPGSAVLNRPMNFPAATINPAQGIESL